MKRLLQFLVVAAWIAGALVGGLPDRPTASVPADDPAQLLVNTAYAQLKVNRSHAILTITTPWQSTWRTTAPTPAMLTPNRPTNRSRSDAAAPPSVVPFSLL